MSKEAEWNKQFNISVDSIDNFHRRPFSIMRKLIYLNKDKIMENGYVSKVSNTLRIIR